MPAHGALIEAAGRVPALHIPSVRFAGGPQGFHVSDDEYASLERDMKKLSSKSLLMASDQDALILDSSPDPEYLALLAGCGCGGYKHIVPSGKEGQCLSEDASICAQTMEFVRGWEGALEFYMVSDMDERLAEKAGASLPENQSNVVSLLNDKVFFIRTLEDLGLPVIETFAGPADAVASRLDKDPGGPVVVRSSRSVGGRAAWVADGAAERLALKKRVEKRRGEIFLLQNRIPTVVSPNLQIYVGAESICVLGLSKQVMEGRIRHVGNLFTGCDDPKVDAAILSQGKVIAMEAARLGYLGVLGIDFIVSESGDILAVEMNARHNASTHALWFANRLINSDPFLASPPGLSAYMRWPGDGRRLSATQWMEYLGEAAFNPDKGYGLLPYDCGAPGLEAALVGKDKEHCKWLIEAGAKAAG